MQRQGSGPGEVRESLSKVWAVDQVFFRPSPLRLGSYFVLSAIPFSPHHSILPTDCRTLKTRLLLNRTLAQYCTGLDVSQDEDVGSFLLETGQLEYKFVMDDCFGMNRKNVLNYSTVK